MLRTVAFSMFTQLGVGLVFAIVFVPREEIGKLYFRVTTLVAAALIIGGLLIRVAEVGAVSWLLSGVAAGLVVYNFVYPRFHTVLLSTLSGLGLFAVALHAWGITEPVAYATVERGLFAANAVAAAWLLGSVLAAMVTGHWYLVESEISLDPLKNSSKLYIISVAFRALVVAASLLFFADAVRAISLLDVVLQFGPDSLFVIGRFAIGLILPFIFGLMIWNTVKIRSTQSATGILYATIVLILIGETFAKFLATVTRIPF